VWNPSLEPTSDAGTQEEAPCPREPEQGRGAARLTRGPLGISDLGPKAAQLGSAQVTYGCPETAGSSGPVVGVDTAGSSDPGVAALLRLPNSAAVGNKVTIPTSPAAARKTNTFGWSAKLPVAIMGRENPGPALHQHVPNAARSCCLATCRAIVRFLPP
jgi:hypothetical protein